MADAPTLRLSHVTPSASFAFAENPDWDVVIGDDAATKAWITPLSSLTTHAVVSGTDQISAINDRATAAAATVSVPIYVPSSVNSKPGIGYRTNTPRRYLILPGVMPQDADFSVVTIIRPDAGTGATRTLFKTQTGGTCGFSAQLISTGGQERLDAQVGTDGTNRSRALTGAGSIPNSAPGNYVAIFAWDNAAKTLRVSLDWEIWATQGAAPGGLTTGLNQTDLMIGVDGSVGSGIFGGEMPDVIITAANLAAAAQATRKANLRNYIYARYGLISPTS